MNLFYFFTALNDLALVLFVNYYAALEHKAIKSTIKLISAPSPDVDFPSLSFPADNFVFPGASFGDFSAADFATEAHNVTSSTTFSPNSTATSAPLFSPVDMPQSTFEAVRRDSFAADNALLAACVVLAVGLFFVFFSFGLGIKKGARSFFCLPEQQQSSSVIAAAFERLYITIEPPIGPDSPVTQTDAEIELERAHARRKELRAEAAAVRRAEKAEVKRQDDLVLEARLAQDREDKARSRLLAPRRGPIGNENRISRREAAAKAAAVEPAETQAEPLAEPLEEPWEEWLSPARRRELLAISGATGNENRLFWPETAAVEPAETQAETQTVPRAAYRGSIFQEYISLVPEQESDPETASDVPPAFVPEPASPELEVTTPTQDAPLRDVSVDRPASIPGAFPGLSLWHEEEASSETGSQEDIDQEQQETSRAPTPAPESTSAEEEASSKTGSKEAIDQEQQETSRAPTPAPESTSAEEEAAHTSHGQKQDELSPTLAPSQDSEDSLEPSEPEVAASDAPLAELEQEDPAQLAESGNAAGLTVSGRVAYQAPTVTEDVFDETAEDVKSQTATPKGDDADIMSGGPFYDRQPGSATPEVEAEESSESSRVNASFGTKVKEDKKVHFAGDDLQQPVVEAENEQASIKDFSNDVMNEDTAAQLPTLDSASPRKRKTFTDDVVIVGSVDGATNDADLFRKRHKQNHVLANQGIDEHETQPADSPTESSTSKISTQTQLPQHAAHLRVEDPVSARRQRRGTTQFRKSPRGSRFSPLRASPPRFGLRRPSKSDVEADEINGLKHAQTWSVYRGPSESRDDSDEQGLEAPDVFPLDLGDLVPSDTADPDDEGQLPDFDPDSFEITLDLEDVAIGDVVQRRLQEPLDRDGNEPMSDPVDGDDNDTTQAGVGSASPFNGMPQHQDVQAADQGTEANEAGGMDIDAFSVSNNPRPDAMNHQAPSPFTNPQAGGFPTMPNNACTPTSNPFASSSSNAPTSNSFTPTSNAFAPLSNPFASSSSNAPTSNAFTPPSNAFAPPSNPFASSSSNAPISNAFMPPSNAFAPRSNPFATVSSASTSNPFASVSSSFMPGSQPPANPFQAPSATQISASNQPPSQAGLKLQPLAAGKGEQPKQALAGAPKRNIPTTFSGLLPLTQTPQQQPTFSGSQPPVNGPSGYSWQGQAPPAQQQQPTFSGFQPPVNVPNFASSLFSAPQPTRLQPLPAGSGQQPTHAGAGAPKRNNGTVLPGLSLSAQGLQQPSSGGSQAPMNNGASSNMATSSAPPPQQQQQQQQPTPSGIQPQRNSGSSFSGFQPSMNNGASSNMATSSAPPQQQQPQPTSSGIQPQRNSGSSFSGFQPSMNNVSAFNFQAPGMNQTPPFNANTAQAPAANTTDQTTQPRIDFPPTAKTIIEPPQKFMGAASQPSVSKSEDQNTTNPTWQTPFSTVPKSNTFPPGSKSANAPANQTKTTPAYQTAIPPNVQPPTARFGTFKTMYKGSPGNELYSDPKDAEQAGKMIHDWLAHALAEGERFMKDYDAEDFSRKMVGVETSDLSIVMKQMQWTADLLVNGRDDWNLAREWSNEWFEKAAGASYPLIRVFNDLGKAKKCAKTFKKLLEHLDSIHERLTMLHGSK